MERVTLGRGGIEVSAVCLGTMTFGNQTGEDEAGRQLDRGLDAGISFFDCAEMYPVNPVRDETAGRSETILGNWIARRGLRDRVQVATKATGKGSAVRAGRGFDGDNLGELVDASLRRLRTDVIDLYQLHWPERGSYAFRQQWRFDPSRQDGEKVRDHMEGVLDAMAALVAAGKVRAFGLSNESTWGTIRWIDIAARRGGPRVVSVQNEYSLLNRLYDTDMAEMAVHEDVTLLAYSPLAAGLLTGKYQDGDAPEGSRAAVDMAHGGKGDLGGRRKPRAVQAVAEYHRLARDHGWNPVHLALSWLLTRPFPVVPILGATTDDQLAAQLGFVERTVPDDLRRAIDDLNRAWPMPF